jgi:4-hydroxy-3-methylbut-2-enyl diphosphate reductase
MSRTSARECLAPGTTVAPREVLVATEIGDPARGLLPCPAAPLVGGVLQRRGLPVRYGPVPHCADASQADDGAVLFVTSSLHRDGAGTAIGAAAAGVNGAAAAAARAAVEEWSAVVGPRRLLGTVSPWCGGARQAMERAEQAVAEEDGPVYVYGRLAASEQARAGLEAAGAVFAGSLAEIPEGAAVLFAAHGVPAAVHGEAAERGLRIIDATCPLVAGVHAEARRLAERGDQVVLIGQSDHAVVPGITGQAPGQVVLADSGSQAGAGGIGGLDPRRVSYLLQPGIPVEEAARVAAALRSRFPALRGPDPDGFCYAASDRAETVRTVAAAADLMLIIGDPGDPDTRQVVALARGGRGKVQVIGDAAEILPSWLAGTSAVGLAETTSARPGLVAEVTSALRGIGPLSVTRRQVTTEVVSAAPRP